MPPRRLGWSWLAGARLLLRPGLGRRVRRLNATVMTVHLWQFVPVIIVAITCYPEGLLPQPAIGSARRWELRPAWLALAAVGLPADAARLRIEAVLGELDDIIRQIRSAAFNERTRPCPAPPAPCVRR